jgi:hypothetical protein
MITPRGGAMSLPIHIFRIQDSEESKKIERDTSICGTLSVTFQCIYPVLCHCQSFSTFQVMYIYESFPVLSPKTLM